MGAQQESVTLSAEEVATVQAEDLAGAPPAAESRAAPPWQVALRESDRRVEHWGWNLAATEGQVLEEVAPETLAVIHAVVQQGDGGVLLSADHQTVSAGPPSAAHAEAQAAGAHAEAARQAARAVLAAKAQEDPAFAALAHLLDALP